MDGTIRAYLLVIWFGIAGSALANLPSVAAPDDAVALIASHFALINNRKYRAAVDQIDPLVGNTAGHLQAYESLFGKAGFVQELLSAEVVGNDGNYVFVRAELLNRPGVGLPHRSRAYYVLRQCAERLYIVTSMGVPTEE